MQFDEIKNPQDSGLINLPEGVPPLTSLYFYIAGSCNLACKHCWISPEFKENPKEGKFVKPEYVRSAIQQAKPLGLNSVKLTGGEPLLHPKFKEILSIIREGKLSSPIETNGILIDEDMAEFLAADENKPFVSVSIDGSNASTHDDLRGVVGSFNKSINGIKYLVKNGIRPQIICSLHQGNILEIEEVVKMAESLGCESVKFNLIQEIGRGTSFKIKFGISIQQTLDLLHLVENSIVPNTQMRVVYDIPIAFYPIKRFLKRNVGKCNVLNILGMLSSGELSLCGIGTTVPELIYGHVKNNDLRKVWCENAGLLDLRKKIPEKLTGICYNCIHKDFCLGACIANTYFKTGKLNAPYFFSEEADRLGLFPDSRRSARKKAI
jgi:SynChlorMet cassette radical SAM/SPASM protein ScmF